MSDPHVLREGHAPTPFTAEEIRVATPAGYTVDTVTRQGGVVVARQRTVFREVDHERAVMVSAAIDEHGDVAGDTREGTATWVDLQGHASFPVELTVVTSDTIVTPLGTIECLRYDVTGDDHTSTFWFAPSYPGMPVRFTSDAADAPTTTVVSITRPS